MSRTETVEETWICDALRAAGKSTLPPSWMLISETKTIFGRCSIGCNMALPYDGAGSMLSSFTDRFTAEALAMIAEDVLKLSKDRRNGGEQWDQYEALLLKLAVKARTGVLIDVQTVESVRERALADGSVR
jgi:hypothetical protein